MGDIEHSGSREQPPIRSFTAYLTEALIKFGTGRSFTPEHLRSEVSWQRGHELTHTPGLTNGASKARSSDDKAPLLYNLATGKGQTITLSPFPATPAAHLQSPYQSNAPMDPEPTQLGATEEDSLIHPRSVANLTFDEPRVLVCTTFVGEASPDMSSFNHWLQNTPTSASKITVEGMFLGPPTMLLISMPIQVWNVVQHDKVCCFLGYVNSHNMTHLYDKLVGSVSVPKATAKDVEDGRMLLEAREVAATTPVVRRHEYLHHDPSHMQIYPETPVRSDGLPRFDPMSVPHSSVSTTHTYANSTPGAVVTNKEDVEDSAEMQQAAEQLKALSHVRHLSGEVASAVRAHLAIDATPEVKHEERPPREANEVRIEGTPNAEHPTPSAKPKPRRSLQKQPPKQETRCSHCSHAPFKDSSSLRKHIAAAHTRPFPCAFAFAGCTSTFGSKNEWKRHISSQHLCLTYYRCSACPQGAAEGLKGNEFNRKDLFTQHLRRMHAPFAIKKAIAKGDSKLQAEWEAHVKDMQQSCLVTRRQPPQRSACPRPDCASVFEGPTSWDEWTEHVGRHMEKGEAGRLGVDRLLARWALIERREEDGEYRLCGTSLGGGGGGGGANGNGNSNGTEKDLSDNHEHNNHEQNHNHHPNHNNHDHNHTKHDSPVEPADRPLSGYKRDRDHDRDHDREREQEDNSSTIVAASTVVEKMDVDR